MRARRVAERIVACARAYRWAIVTRLRVVASAVLAHAGCGDELGGGGERRPIVGRRRVSAAVHRISAQPRRVISGTALYLRGAGKVGSARVEAAQHWRVSAGLAASRFVVFGGLVAARGGAGQADQGQPSARGHVSRVSAQRLRGPMPCDLCRSATISVTPRWENLGVRPAKYGSFCGSGGLTNGTHAHTQHAMQRNHLSQSSSHWESSRAFSRSV